LLLAQIAPVDRLAGLQRARKRAPDQRRGLRQRRLGVGRPVDFGRLQVGAGQHRAGRQPGGGDQRGREDAHRQRQPDLPVHLTFDAAQRDAGAPPEAPRWQPGLDALAGSKAQPRIELPEFDDHARRLRAGACLRRLAERKLLQSLGEFRVDHRPGRRACAHAGQRQGRHRRQGEGDGEGAGRRRTQGLLHDPAL
jgi:hypothetical protein